jgi:hypothetical protein
VILTLVRTERDAYGTFGLIYTREFPPLATCEPPWVEWSDRGRKHWSAGKPFESCVPSGEYQLIWHHSAKYGWRWHLEGGSVHVKNPNKTEARYACLIHAANWPDQLEGCISVGRHLGNVAGRYGVSRSQYALQLFESWLPTEERHELQIINA